MRLHLGELLDEIGEGGMETAALFREHSKDLNELKVTPRSYVYVPVGSVLTLPLLPWTFRGFSIAVWVQLPPPPPVEVGPKRIRLFKFYSTSKKMGVECTLAPLNDDCTRVSLSVASATNEKGWRHVSSQFVWDAQQWHLVVVTHKQHYLKRSHVECYVNTTRVMSEDLSYPTPTGPMSQCLIGGVDPGGATAPFQLSGMTMYEDELRPDMMAALHRHGPSHTCLRRLFLGVNPFQNTFLDTKSLAKVSTHEKTLTSEMSMHLKIVFSFSAHDVIEDDEGRDRPSLGPVLCTQWSCEGDRDRKGRWTRFKAEGDHALSQQTHVVLSPGVFTLSHPDRADVWFRTGGIPSVLLLLHVMLSRPSAEMPITLGYGLSLLQGLLRNSIAHQEEMLHQYGFHLLSHVLRSHGGDNEELLSASNATACVELVVANYLDLHSGDPDPIPLFVVGVQALLLDFDLWSTATFKTQSILLQQLVGLLKTVSCLHRIVSTQLIVDILRRHYLKAALAKRKTKDPTWVDECVRSLVTFLEATLAPDDVAPDASLRIFVVGDAVLQSPSGSIAADTALESVLLPIALVRNVRTATRFLLVCPDALLSRAILTSLSSRAVCDPPMYIALLGANALDCILYLLQPKHALATRLSALRLFVLLYEWLESSDGRGVVSSLERHLQLDLVDDSTASLFQELLFDASFFMGLRHTVAMNDPSMTGRDANAFAEAPTKGMTASSSRLVLSYDDRLVALRAMALRSIQEVSHATPNMPNVFADGLMTLMTLPLRGTLPFIACLFKHVPSISTSCRERILMEISVYVKTDMATQKQLLSLPWVEWFTDLLASCCIGPEPQETGEDLVFDTIVTLLCAAMYAPQGWTAMAHFLSLVRAPPPADGNDRGANPFRAANVFVWSRRLLGLVLVRLVRSKTILSRALAENVHHLVILAYYLLLGVPDDATHVTLLLSSVLDVVDMLLESTNKKHRAGLVPALRLCRAVLPLRACAPVLVRLVQSLEAALQQEVGQRIPIDENVPTHEMLVRVLCSLALGLAGQPSTDDQNLLGDLTLKIATSGEFAIALSKGRVSIEMLSALPAPTAARLVLDTLVPHGREDTLHPSEMADLALTRQTLFPGLVAGEETPPDTDAEKRKVVLAASQVEEARMMEVLKEISKKEQERMLTEDARVQLRAQWTDDCWKQVETKLRSELSRVRGAEYELSRHETPQRRRVRLDVYLKPTSHLLLQAKAPAPISRDDLLQKVGRVIAQQPKPAIEDDVVDEEAIQNNIRSRRGTIGRGADSDDEEDDDEDDERTVVDEEEEEAATGGLAPDDATRVPLEAIKLPTIEAAKSLHPSGGIGLVPDDRIYLQPLCRKVVPEGFVLGTFYVCDNAAVFTPQVPHVRPGADAEWAVGLHRSHRWKLKDVVAVYLRRYRLRESALELFLRDGSTHFIDFHMDGANAALTTSIRNDTIRTLLALVPNAAIKQWPGFPVSRMLGRLTREWQARSLSNYEYLMALNTLAGRTFNDLTQYPVFPWVLSNYTAEHLDLSDPTNFRDLSKPMGALNEERLHEYWERYHSFDDPVIPKFLYGSHYSTAAGVVLYFLVRLQPFASLHQVMQGGVFDLPDRLFNSVSDVWDMCNSSMSEVKELTPEWFSTSAFLKNLNAFDLGARQDGKPIGDVELPPWANDDPEAFVRLHRAALESEFVSAHLHEWIDLIFGFKQRGDDALAANNVFYYLTYYGLVDLDAIEDPMLRTAMEQQIAHFGQCPRQLFSKGHPPRGPATSASATVPRPLAVAYQSPVRSQSSVLSRSLGGDTAIRAIKILSDRVLAVNDLGVIELHHWKLHAKAPASAGRKSDELLKDDDVSSNEWKLSTDRDLSPFDVVPRLPIFASGARLPVAISEHGRVFATGGASTGSIHLRLVDLANGHILAKASVDGHADVVTCLDMDTLGQDEFLLSGAKDCSVLLWQFSNMNSPFRLPRISSSPLMVYRGHDAPLSACHLNARLGIVASASASTCLVHNVHTGHVLFRAPAVDDATFEQLASSQRGFVVTRSTRRHGTGSVLAIFTIAGTCVRVHDVEPCSSIIVSPDGGLVLAHLEFAVRVYRLDDLAILHEYKTSTELPAAITCGAVGPSEAIMLAVTGHADGSLVWHRLPDADGRVSVLGSVGRFLNINSRLKVVKGTVQQAQTLAMTTMDNARAVTNTAKDIAGEAKTLMQSIFGLLKSG
ncbi:hypothetical protein SPRG_10478 [Saprolegnia parasitica CBS 223.65]|uniref:BEACH domain-containing protein n=1 Tax=Saprolegnia parasitica (strain CBS 223.65) TaxID=695850 RepID=A0A067C3M3_SAPPC|nr:hypothetical protein SPRG_10478 [Saprolegnia parasitica CBS 223.65]KDO23700.1 hypothetical protein SPRG_10478 [Saprolegnia parasitica CBS 223.65]|eukprot:XP_012205518.1 hypothetical protein SPRG_10478 [Saprolegnia parasitica CBS 223.65]